MCVSRGCVGAPSRCVPVSMCRGSTLSKLVDFRISINGLAALVELDIKVEVFIHFFVICRKSWLFSDASKDATAGVQLYSLIETAKANARNSTTWLCHVLERLPVAQSVEDHEVLLTLSCSPASAS